MQKEVTKSPLLPNHAVNKVITYYLYIAVTILRDRKEAANIHKLRHSLILRYFVTVIFGIMIILVCQFYVPNAIFGRSWMGMLFKCYMR